MVVESNVLTAFRLSTCDYPIRTYFDGQDMSTIPIVALYLRHWRPDIGNAQPPAPTSSAFPVYSGVSGANASVSQGHNPLAIAVLRVVVHALPGLAKEKQHQLSANIREQ